MTPALAATNGRFAALSAAQKALSLQKASCASAQARRAARTMMHLDIANAVSTSADTRKAQHMICCVLESPSACASHEATLSRRLT
eukprot:372415-Amphidinium_carterae.1